MLKKKNKLIILSLISCLAFLLIFQVSDEILEMFFSFLKTQDIPSYTPVKVGNTFLLTCIFCGVVIYCIILIVFHHIQYDKIKKKIRTASYILGHIFVCLPIGFLALKGINKCVTLLFNNLPFEVWPVFFLIADLIIYMFIYRPITISMESMADSYLKKERKNHSLEIYYSKGTKTEKVSTLIPMETFSICYKTMKSNLNELKPDRIFVITQYGPFKKQRHHWHYDNHGNLSFRD